MLIVDRRCGASKIIDLVQFQVEWEGHIVADELEARIGTLRCSIFCLVPVNRLSTHKTSCPCLSNLSIKCEPRNPAPPVTRIRLRLSYKRATSSTPRWLISIHSFFSHACVADAINLVPIAPIRNNFCWLKLFHMVRVEP